MRLCLSDAKLTAWRRFVLKYTTGKRAVLESSMRPENFVLCGRGSNVKHHCVYEHRSV